MCVVDATDDLSSEKYTPCCDVGPWSYGGDNLDGQLGRVKEVRDVYNCPSNVNNTQYERNVCYKGGWEEAKRCEGKFRTYERNVINCPSGTSTIDVREEDVRPHLTTMGSCHNITGVTKATIEFEGIEESYCRLKTIRMVNGSLVTEEQVFGDNPWTKPPALFDSPRDVIEVMVDVHLNKPAKYSDPVAQDVYIKFYDGDTLIKTLHMVATWSKGFGSRPYVRTRATLEKPMLNTFRRKVGNYYVSDTYAPR